MLSTRRSRLLLHFLHPRLSPLPASAEITDTAGQAPYLCRHVNTENHLWKAPCDNGGHGPVCKTKGHSLAPHILCRDAALQAFPVKKEGCDEALPNVCTQSFVKLSASRKKGHFSHGDVRFSGLLDANGHPSDGEVKVSESNANLSKASRTKRHARSMEVKAKASRETSFLSYGDGGAVQNPCSTDGAAAAAAAGAVTSKYKNNRVRSHVSDAPCGLLDPSLHPLQALLIGAPSKGKELSQIDIAELHRKVELLEAEKMAVNDAAKLFKSRAFRSVSFEHLSAVLQVLKEFLGTGERACQALARSSLFLLHPLELLQQTFQVLADFHINKQTARMLFTCTCPPLYVKVELLQRRLIFFKEYGFTAQAINKMCLRNPQILRLSVENILHSVQFLERTGITKERLLYVLWKCPNVLAYSVDDNLILKFEYLWQLGFSGKKLSVVILQLVTRSLESLQARVQSIKDQGFSDEDVQGMITRCPTLLGLSTQNLKAKFNYLIHEQNWDMAEIARHPVCLLYSLHGRVIPRFKYMEKLGLSKAYPLYTILCCSDVQFRKKFRAVV